MESSVSDIFKSRLPHRPYCSDDLNQGLLVRPTHTALKYRHIQPNPPLKVAWLVFDLDYRGAAFAWDDAGLPPPTLTVVNPTNAHAHLFYGLTTPVVMSDAARDAPIRYAAALQSAFGLKLHADQGYAGLIAKNPFHDAWHSIWVQHLYDLGELNEYVDLPKRLPKRDSFGLGRNCTLFDEIRTWAYQQVREFKRNGVGSEQWQMAVQSQAERLKADKFDLPLPLSEIRAISKSIARWTWRQFSPQKFSAIQSARGKRGGRPQTTTANGAPWAVMGISRATYYRRLKCGILVPG